MRVIPPIAITPAMLTSSTATEPLAPADYAAGTTYANGDLIKNPVDGYLYESIQSANTGNTPAVSPLFWQQLGYAEPAWAVGTNYGLNATVSYNHRIWQSLIAGNLGNQPDISPDKWSDVGATNKWRCFDILRNSVTVGASPLTIVVAPGTRFDTLALLGMTADTVRVRVKVSGVTLYDVTTDLVTRFVANWYEYFYAGFVNQQSVLALNLPISAVAIVTIDLTRATGKCAIGSVVLGMGVSLGVTQFNPQSDVLNFSTITRDTFGNSVLVPRRNVPKSQQRVLAQAVDVDRIRYVRNLLNATPAVWAGLDDASEDYFEALLILGIYKQFTIDLSYPAQAVLTLELEEV
jgi:hypothetical protein